MNSDQPEARSKNTQLRARAEQLERMLYGRALTDAERAKVRTQPPTTIEYTPKPAVQRGNPRIGSKKAKQG